MQQNNGLNRKQIMLISLSALIFVSAAVASDIMIKATQGGVPPAVSAEETADEKPQAVYSDISSSLTDSLTENEYVPGPEVLNLAYYYPEGADTKDVINSYAGRIYSQISENEAQYLAGYYDLYDKSPKQLASELGLSADRVMGQYDPTDPTHDPNDSSTWTVNRFKNVNVAFYDGDGNRINEYSAVKEIVSMASVYSYYHDMMDAEAMAEHAEELWSASHSSSITLGSVYYCSGCLNRSAEDEAREAMEQEEEQERLREELARATAKSAGDAALAALGIDTSSQTTAQASDTAAGASGGSLSGSEASLGSTSAGLSGSAASGEMSAAASSEASGAGSTGSAGSGTSDSGTVSETSSMTAAESQSASGPSQDTGTAHTQQSSEPQSSASAGGYFESGGQRFRLSSGLGLEDHMDYEDAKSYYTASGSSYTESSAAAETAAQTTAAAQTEAGSASSGSSLSEASDAILGSIMGSLGGSQTGGSSSGTANSQGTGAAGSVSSGTAQDSGSGVHSAGSDASQSSSYCPGHIDVYVTISLKGIDDENGLPKADVIGNDPANFTDSWQGWTEDKLEEARALNALDWFSNYGLTISAINVGRPLSTEEISYYMSLLSPDISQERRDVIEFALNSVGKVPYYWGGKPYGAGYERNHFGTVTYPDAKGRVLRGLDCSGWINWVYWSIRGESLPGESTGTLVGCGRKISRSELRPGDIIIRTGADAHVVMFLAWAESGNMIVVHETGGVTNNVVVSEITADWPYYRTLIYD
ncbi:MAG TPA: C40 family peptidase [Candidatus Avilachnospira avistercoris]|nr:C40 family peptidase [Candidatus Avilachnospira avistercoris]